MEFKLTEKGREGKEYFGGILTVNWFVFFTSASLLLVRVGTVAFVGWMVGYLTLALLFLFILDFRELFTGRYK